MDKRTIGEKFGSKKEVNLIDKNHFLIIIDRKENTNK